MMLAFLLRKYRFDQIRIRLEYVTKDYIYAIKYAHLFAKYSNEALPTFGEELIKFYAAGGKRDDRLE